jgi:hypothetical protein
MPRPSADRPSASHADASPPSRTKIVLKWIGRATALLAFVFAVIQFVKVVSDVRDRKRQIDELVRTEQLQAQANNYAAAWASLDRALSIAESGGQRAKLTGQLGAIAMVNEMRRNGETVGPTIASDADSVREVRQEFKRNDVSRLADRADAAIRGLSAR